MVEPVLINFSENETIDEFWKGLRHQFFEIERAIEHSQMFLRLGSAEPEIGDHLVTPRYGNIYTHHGVYIGNFTVLHYAGASGTGEDQSVQEVSLDTFSGGPDGPGFIVTHHNDIVFTGDEIVERAKSRVGENRYNFLFNNCEHFANWCIADQSESKQVGSIDIFNNGNRLRYQSLMQIGKLVGRGGCMLVAGLLNAGQKIVEAEKSAEIAKTRSDRKLNDAEDKWIESERVRFEIRAQIQAQFDLHFNELHAITDDIETELNGGDVDSLHHSVDAFLDKIGSNKRSETLSEFKERFGFNKDS